jgi:hypothetical protein
VHRQTRRNNRYRRRKNPLAAANPSPEQKKSSQRPSHTKPGPPRTVPTSTSKQPTVHAPIRPDTPARHLRPCARANHPIPSPPHATSSGVALKRPRCFARAQIHRYSPSPCLLRLGRFQKSARRDRHGDSLGNHRLARSRRNPWRFPSRFHGMAEGRQELSTGQPPWRLRFHSEQCLPRCMALSDNQHRLVYHLSCRAHPPALRPPFAPRCHPGSTTRHSPPATGPLALVDVLRGPIASEADVAKAPPDGNRMSPSPFGQPWPATEGSSYLEDPE